MENREKQLFSLWLFWPIAIIIGYILFPFLCGALALWVGLTLRVVDESSVEGCLKIIFLGSLASIIISHHYIKKFLQLRRIFEEQNKKIEQLHKKASTFKYLCPYCNEYYEKGGLCPIHQIKLQEFDPVEDRRKKDL